MAFFIKIIEIIKVISIILIISIISISVFDSLYHHLISVLVLQEVPDKTLVSVVVHHAPLEYDELDFSTVDLHQSAPPAVKSKNPV